ncbi:MAG: sporulation protein YabP [bacterium]|nr:sporulation protein YabP [bacterium]
MDKNINSLSSISQNHGISINERKNMYITGVIKIDSFDEEEFLIETTMGYLVIKGTDLEIVKLDTKDGIISIKGSLISLSYIEELKKMNKENSLFNKLFK